MFIAYLEAVSTENKRYMFIHVHVTVMQFGLTYHDEESHELDEIPIEDLDKYYLLYGHKAAANAAVQDDRLQPARPPQTLDG